MSNTEKPLDGDNNQPTGGFSFGERTTRAIENLTNRLGDGGNAFVERVDSEVIKRGPQIDAATELPPRVIETSMDTLAISVEKFIQSRQLQAESSLETMTEVLNNPNALAKLSNAMSVSFFEAQDLGVKVAIGLAALPIHTQEQVRMLIPEGPLVSLSIIAASFAFYFAAKMISSYNKGEVPSVPMGESNSLDAEPVADLLELLKELGKKS